MPTIELIYDADCPNIKAARQQLMRALFEMQMPVKWTEWERNQDDAPTYTQQYGSPTILVNQVDVAKSSGANCCRVYRNETGKLVGIPSLASIKNKLAIANPFGGASTHDQKTLKLKSVFTLVPGIFVLLLPKLSCAACWPAYAAFLSAIGVNFVNYTPYLLPFAIAMLAICLASLVYKANKRRGYGPFYLGLISSVAILLSSFVFDIKLLTYFFAGTLTLATLWNLLPPKTKRTSCCSTN